jgi:hypothetical protein
LADSSRLTGDLFGTEQYELYATAGAGSTVEMFFFYHSAEDLLQK